MNLSQLRSYGSALTASRLCSQPALRAMFAFCAFWPSTRAPSVGRRGGRQNPIRSLSGQVLWPRHPRVRPRLIEMGFAPTDYAFGLSRTTRQGNRRAGTGSDALARLEREPERADTAASSTLVSPRLLSQRVTSAGISSLFGARRPEVLLASMVSGAKHRNQLPLRHARIRGHPTPMVSGRRGRNRVEDVAVRPSPVAASKVSGR